MDHVIIFIILSGVKTPDMLFFICLLEVKLTWLFKAFFEYTFLRQKKFCYIPLPEKRGGKNERKITQRESLKSMLIGNCLTVLH